MAREGAAVPLVLLVAFLLSPHSGRRLGAAWAAGVGSSHDASTLALEEEPPAGRGVAAVRLLRREAAAEVAAEDELVEEEEVEDDEDNEANLAAKAVDRPFFYWGLTWNVCKQRLVGGVAGKVINDTQISASSYLLNAGGSGKGEMWRSRLDNLETPWLADKSDHDQWIQWNFTEIMTLTKIATKGDQNELRWVRAYRISYSEDWGTTWEWFPKVFRGNFGPSSVRYNKIKPPINATTVRLHPMTWFTRIALRAELFGCGKARTDPEGDFKICAEEGGTCPCRGVVFFGARRRQFSSCNGTLNSTMGTCTGPWRQSFLTDYVYTDVDGDVACDLKQFREPDSTLERVQARTGTIKRSCGCMATTDIPAYIKSERCQVRRRGMNYIEYSMPGVNRRRRLCGYGPQDCVWSHWSDYGSCFREVGGKLVKMRTRAQVTPAVNGGYCRAANSNETVACTAPDVVNQIGCHGNCTRLVTRPSVYDDGGAASGTGG